MGMGIFDLAVAQAILSRAQEVAIGVDVPEKSDRLHQENA
jgi:ornithine cyclodeaminase/alanine dehydrogenase-like protein (mu-crystallin family)